MFSVVGLIGAVIGAITTQIGNYILLNKQFNNEKKKLIFNQNLDILQEIKINNVELTLTYKEKIGLNAADIKTSIMDRELELITKLATFSFRNLKLSNKLIDVKINNVEDLHSKILEVQNAMYRSGSQVSLWNEAEVIITQINNDIDTEITKIYSRNQCRFRTLLKKLCNHFATNKNKL